MEVKIGVQNVAREISVETDMTPDEVSKAVAKALDGATLDITDHKGRRVVVPSTALAYVEIGSTDKRPVGFAG